MFKKKKEIIIPKWDREEEYQRAYSKMIFAESEYDDAIEETREEKKAAWIEAKKIFEPLYAQREEWLDKTGARPTVARKEKVSKDTKLAAGVTILGIALPPLIENRGIIIKGMRDWIQKPRLWRK